MNVFRFTTRRAYSFSLPSTLHRTSGRTLSKTVLGPQPFASSVRFSSVGTHNANFDNRLDASQMEPPQREDRDENLTFTLPTGRVIGYARYGVASSKFPSTVYLHGYPTSRIEPAMVSRELHDAGLQVIAIDRPGFGLSSPDPARTSTLDHANDVGALASHLELNKFAVVGVSGGAPYALACAKALPGENLVGVGVLAGMGPYEMAVSPEVWKDLQWINKLGFIGPARFPTLHAAIYRVVLPWVMRGSEAKSYDKVLNSRGFRSMPAADQEMIRRIGEEGYKDSIRSAIEAMRQDRWLEHHMQEARLLTKPWKFRLEDVKHGNIKLWYGTEDKNTPLTLGQKIAERLPGAELKAFQGGTHASVVVDMVKMIRELLAV